MREQENKRMERIMRLPKSVHSVVRSSIILFDLPRVVEELTYNSIDAGATKVDVQVNVRACSVKVTDDGCGITRDGLVLLGEKYVTSKHYPVDGFDCGTSNLGFKGETLGSLSDISLVEIRTKARGWPNSYCKIIKGSKCIYMEIDDKREAVGTTVTVRDLFYNQPVRRKCMQSSPKKELHSVKKSVLQIALVHPEILFRVYDMESEDELLCTVPSSSPLPLISDGFGKDVSSCLHEVVHSDQLLTLSGYISGPCDASTKDLQYLYINSRHVRKNPIHNLINNLATQWQSCTGANRDEPKTQSKKRLKSVAYPAFLLNLCCPLSSYDLNYEPSKAIVEFKELNAVLAFFEKAVIIFWKDMLQQLLDEAQNAKDSRLCLEREIREEERQKPLISDRRKKFKVASWKTSPKKDTLEATDHSTLNQRKKNPVVTNYKSPPMKNVLEASNQYTLFETPIDSCASFFDLNTCTSDNSHSYWSKCDSLYHPEDKYLPNTSPMVRTNYQITEPTLEGQPPCTFGSLKEDRPFLLACSRPSVESSHFVENEKPREAYTSHYMDLGNSREEFFNCETRSTDKIHYNKYGTCGTSVWDSPGATGSDFGSPQKEIFFDVPFWSGTGSYQNEWCRKKQRLMDHHNQSFEPVRGIFSESPVLSCDEEPLWDHEFSPKKSQLFDILIDETSFSPPLDSPILEKRSYISPNEKDSPLLNSSVTKKLDWDNGLEDLLEVQNLRCYPSAHHCKVTIKPRRSMSAPPFYRGKCKYSYLNDCLTTLTGESSTNSFPKATTEAMATIRDTAPEIHLSHPCPDPEWCETSELHPREKEKEEASHASRPRQHDKFEHAGDELTKWRVDPVQFPVVSMPHNSIDDILNISSGLLHLSSTSLIPESIDRDCLKNAKVLLQLDKKFIPVIASGTLVILDQHAADERIRLEELRRKVLSGEGCGSTFLNPEEELVLPEMGFQLLEKYGEQIKKWGWLTSIDSQSSDPFKKSMSLLKRHEGHNSAISLVAVSTYLNFAMVPCILGTNLTSKDLLEFLEQLGETDGSGNLPPAVVRNLNLKACRGAIMFGDALLPSECSLILEELKATSLCFQCAHGRPTTVPLLNINRLHVELEKIKMQNVGPDDKWHGLTHHKLSVEYAQKRLNHGKM